MTRNGLRSDVRPNCMLHLEIRYAAWVSKDRSDSESSFSVALESSIWPHIALEGHSGFCGEAMLCASRSSLVSIVGKLERPLASSVRNPSTQQTQSRAATFTHWNKQVFLILPGWWTQIIITGLITGTAVTVALVISRHSNPMLLFIFSSTHQLMNEANRNTNHTSRE